MKRRIESILHQMPNNSEDLEITPTQLISKYHFLHTISYQFIPLQVLIHVFI